MGLPVSDWKGDPHPDLKGCVVVYFENESEKLHIEVSEPVQVVKC